MRNSLFVKGLYFVIVLLLGQGLTGNLFSQVNNQKEGRAIWVSSTMFDLEKSKAITQIEETLDKYGSIGINTLYCFSSMPDQNNKNWDFLNVFIKAAHSRDMEVHPIFCPGGGVKLEGDIKQHPEWLIRGKKHEIYPYLNLAHLGAQDYILGKLSEALEYNIDGIQLDYLRFQVNQGFSYDKANCSAFKKEFGISPLEIKNQDSGNSLWCEWIKWNDKQVTDFVRRMKNLMDESGKNITLSADVFPDHEIAKMEIGQDWEQWANEELIDVYCPMLYTDNNNVFRRGVRRAVKLNKGKKGMVYAGIGIRSSHNNAKPVNVARQVRIAREEGADGVVFFFGSHLTEEFISELKSDVFKSPIIKKLGTIDCDLVETSPVVFNGKLYRFEYVRTKYEHNKTGDSYLRFIDHESGEATPSFGKGFHLGSAFVSDNTAYVTAVDRWGGEQVVMFVSTDLINWEKRSVLDLPGNKIYNTSLCKAYNQYVLMYEIGDPPEEAGQRFTARFAVSTDLTNWKVTPPECNYAKDRYTAPHALRYLNGYYYDFYLEAKGNYGTYETYVVRSRDLIHWEASSLNPVLKASDEDKIIAISANPGLSENQKLKIAQARNLNNSDIDFCEFNGKLIINYSWGDQVGTEFLAEAVYDGTLEEFLKGWFPCCEKTEK
ncbi:family 10 glycosylhydrolase [bacterium]|nr:family 10 glycosylhydrolase [bacterium]